MANEVCTAALDRFMSSYELALYEALAKHPEDYTYGPDAVPSFLPRWRAALVTDSFSHNSHAMRGTCTRLGIKYTRKAILQFLKGE